MKFLVYCDDCKYPIMVADGYNEFETTKCLRCGFKELNDKDQKNVIENNKEDF